MTGKDVKEVGFKAVARRMLAGALCCLAVSGSMLAANTPFRTAENVSEIHITKQIPFTAVSRASESFNIKVSKNTVAAAGSAFSLEAGDHVTINAVYSPAAADVEIGLIAPDGLFYSVRGVNGSIKKGIIVNEHGNYTLAIRNNSSSTVTITGFVTY